MRQLFLRSVSNFKTALITSPWTRQQRNLHLQPQKPLIEEEEKNTGRRFFLITVFYTHTHRHHTDLYDVLLTSASAATYTSHTKRIYLVRVKNKRNVLDRHTHMRRGLYGCQGLLVLHQWKNFVCFVSLMCGALQRPSETQTQLKLFTTTKKKKKKKENDFLKKKENNFRENRLLRKRGKTFPLK